MEEGRERGREGSRASNQGRERETEIVDDECKEGSKGCSVG
jgi:hypothetical protein